MFESIFDLVIQSAVTIILFLIAKFIYDIYTCRQTRSKDVPILKVDWKKDVVYLYQFPRSKCTPNLSPYCVKLETFLRHHKIPFEVKETMTLRSRTGKLPFVEFNGQHLHDSQLIICTLTKHFNLEDNLSEEQRGVVRSVSRMLDQGTHYNILYFKIGTNTMSFIETTLDGRAPAILKYVAYPFFYPNMWKLLNMEGTGKHSPEEVQAILRADLNAIDQILGDKEWIVGEEPSLADFAFFGHAAGSYNVPYDHPIQHMLDTEFPRLKAHHERMAKTYFPGVNFARCST